MYPTFQLFIFEGYISVFKILKDPGFFKIKCLENNYVVLDFLKSKKNRT